MDDRTAKYVSDMLEAISEIEVAVEQFGKSQS